MINIKEVVKEASNCKFYTVYPEQKTLKHWGLAGKYKI